MSEINTGGPAFPQVELDRITGAPCDQHFGMTMRDAFALGAMQGMMANSWNDNYDAWACHAYLLADAMLKARGEK